MNFMFRKNRMIEMDQIQFADFINDTKFSASFKSSDLSIAEFRSLNNYFVPSKRYALDSFVKNGNKVDVFVIFQNRALLFIEKTKHSYTHTVYTTTKTEGLYLDFALELVNTYKIS